MNWNTKIKHFEMKMNAKWGKKKEKKIFMFSVQFFLCFSFFECSKCHYYNTEKLVQTWIYSTYIHLKAFRFRAHRWKIEIEVVILKEQQSIQMKEIFSIISFVFSLFSISFCFDFIYTKQFFFQMPASDGWKLVTVQPTATTTVRAKTSLHLSRALTYKHLH